MPWKGYEKFGGPGMKSLSPPMQLFLGTYGRWTGIFLNSGCGQLEMLLVPTVPGKGESSQQDNMAAKYGRTQLSECSHGKAPLSSFTQVSPGRPLPSRGVSNLPFHAREETMSFLFLHSVMLHGGLVRTMTTRPYTNKKTRSCFATASYK